MPIDKRGHVDAQLSNFSVAFAEDARDEGRYMHTRVFPTFGVERQSDTFLVYPRGWFTRSHIKERPLGQEPHEADYGLDEDSYRAKEFALAMTLDDRERSNVSPPFDPEESHTEFLTDNMLIFRERKWANDFFRSGVWGTDLQGVATSVSGSAVETQIQQFNQANAPLQRSIDRLKMRMIGRSGKLPNVIVFGAQAWVEVKNHPEIIERTKYTSSDAITRQLIANYFEVDEVLVPMATENVAPELAPQFAEQGEDVYDFIINPYGMLLLYRDRRVGLRTQTAGVTLTWNGLIGGGGFPMPIYTDRKRRAWSDWFAIRSAFAYKVVAPDCGVYVDEITPRPA